jgi:hypothetical protein
MGVRSLVPTISYCTSHGEESCNDLKPKRPEEKVYKQTQIGEFMTTWKDFQAGLAAGGAPKGQLMGSAKSARYTPRFRPFDMLSIPNQRW